MFRYWLQGGRIKVGFLGGAQIDKYANLNTTVVGPYDAPKVRRDSHRQAVFGSTNMRPCISICMAWQNHEQ